MAAGEPVWGARKSPFGDLFDSNNVQYLMEGSRNIDSSRLLEEKTAIPKCAESDGRVGKKLCFLSIIGVPWAAKVAIFAGRVAKY